MISRPVSLPETKGCAGLDGQMPLFDGGSTIMCFTKYAHRLHFRKSDLILTVFPFKSSGAYNRQQKICKLSYGT